ncbi:hypothetical protein THS27_06805 [Thalassospira sp. MCCC 1A01428]|nr:hypothetical protein THS27_06805 [Thalassospira sp. MCCC 1A01428]
MPIFGNDSMALANLAILYEKLGKPCFLVRNYTCLLAQPNNISPFWRNKKSAQRQGQQSCAIWLTAL